MKSGLRLNFDYDRIRIYPKQSGKWAEIKAIPVNFLRKFFRLISSSILVSAFIIFLKSELFSKSVEKNASRVYMRVIV